MESESLLTQNQLTQQGLASVLVYYIKTLFGVDADVIYERCYNRQLRHELRFAIGDGPSLATAALRALGDQAVTTPWDRWATGILRWATPMRPLI